MLTDPVEDICVQIRMSTMIIPALTKKTKEKTDAIAAVNGPVEVYGFPVDKIRPLWTRVGCWAVNEDRITGER